LQEVEEGAVGGHSDHGAPGHHGRGEDQQAGGSTAGQTAPGDGAVGPAEGSEDRYPYPGGQNRGVEDRERDRTGDLKGPRRPVGSRRRAVVVTRRCSSRSVSRGGTEVASRVMRPAFLVIGFAPSGGWGRRGRRREVGHPRRPQVCRSGRQTRERRIAPTRRATPLRELTCPSRSVAREVRLRRPTRAVRCARCRRERRRRPRSGCRARHEPRSRAGSR
jgi:hypothetical protein